MSAYLDLLIEKREMGLISDARAKSRKKHYDELNSKSEKENLDNQAEKKLRILKQDKSTFLSIELISLVSDSKRSTNTIKNWVTFFGILYILGVVVGMIALSKI